MNRLWSNSSGRSPGHRWLRFAAPAANVPQGLPSVVRAAPFGLAWVRMNRLWSYFQDLVVHSPRRPLEKWELALLVAPLAIGSCTTFRLPLASRGCS